MVQIDIPNTLPRILAITSHMGAITELRIKNPLRALHRMQKISGYEVVDTGLEFLKTDHSQYHAIIVQRAVPEYIYKSFNSLNIPYALDIDDNMLATPDYQKDVVYNTIFAGLSGCSVLITPNERLVYLLEKYSGYLLSEKSFIVPNALPYPKSGCHHPTQPTQLLWIQSDVSALTYNRDEIIHAVSDFSIKFNLPIILIGRNVLENFSMPNQVIMGEIDFTANLQLLEYIPTSIGIAPLETVADEETLDFIAGKSDLKMLLFTGYGHPGVYSRSPPYEDSPFRDIDILVNNSYLEWFRALEYQYHTGWQKVNQNAMLIQEERHINRIALEKFLPAILKIILHYPMTGTEIYEIINRARMKYIPLLMGYNILINAGFQKNDLMALHNRLYSGIIKKKNIQTNISDKHNIEMK